MRAFLRIIKDQAEQRRELFRKHSIPFLPSLSLSFWRSDVLACVRTCVLQGNNASERELKRVEERGVGTILRKIIRHGISVVFRGNNLNCPVKKNGVCAVVCFGCFSLFLAAIFSSRPFFYSLKNFPRLAELKIQEASQERHLASWSAGLELLALLRICQIRFFPSSSCFYFSL